MTTLAAIITICQLIPVAVTAIEDLINLLDKLIAQHKAGITTVSPELAALILKNVTESNLEINEINEIVNQITAEAESQISSSSNTK